MFFLLLSLSANVMAQQCYSLLPENYQIPLEATRAPLKKVFRNDVIRVPLTIHFVRGNSASYSVNVNVLARHIKKANEVFSEAGIEFYMCSYPNLVTEFSTYNFYNSDGLHDRFGVPNTLNIYYVERIEEFGTQAFAKLPDERDPSNSMIVMDGFQDEGIFIHELGHYFGLLHTHETINGIEWVNGQNCSTAGDGICDTPADPNLLNVNFFGCTFSGRLLDQNGEPYKPSTSNFMSYTKSHCRKDFTPTQYSIMRYFAENFHQFSTTCKEVGLQNFIIDANAPLSGSKVFPNPTSGDVNLFLSNDSRGPVQLTIRNAQGQIIRSNINQKQQKEQYIYMDIGDLPKGIYFVQLHFQRDDLEESYRVLVQ